MIHWRRKMVRAFYLAFTGLTVLPAEILGPPQNHQAILEQLSQRAEQTYAEEDPEKVESESRQILGTALGQIGAIHTALGEHAKAEQAYREACRISPVTPAPFIGLASVYLRTGDYDRGIEWIGKVLELNPLHSEARHLLGQLYFAQGRFEKAAEELRDAYNLNPDYPGVAYTLGLTALKLKRLEKTREMFSQVVEQMGDSPQLRILLGRAYRETGYLDGAVKEFERALELDPEDTTAKAYLRLTQSAQESPAAAEITPPSEAESASGEMVAHAEEFPDETVRRSRDELEDRYRTIAARAYANLARIYLERSDFNSATDYLKRVAIWDDSLPHLFSLRDRIHAGRKPEKVNARPGEHPMGSIGRLLASADSAFKEGDTAKAWTYLSQARELAPASPQVLLQFAQAGLANGMVADAVFALRLLLLMELNRPQYLYLVGVALLRTDEFPMATEPLSRYTQERPEDAKGHQMLGYAKFLIGDNEEAAAHLREAVRLNPELPEAYFHLAQIAYRRGNNEKTEELLRKAITTAGDYGQARVSLAKIYFLRGEYEKALDELKRAAQLIPHDSEIHYRLSRVYRQLGDLEKARQELALYAEYKQEEATSRQYGRKIRFSSDQR